MSIKNWPGGRISSIPPTPSGPYENSTASGVWTLDQQAYWKAQNQWPTAGNIQPDPFFENVTLLLHGDGTNGAQNNTFLDSSTNNFTITRNGNTTQGSFSPYGTLWSNFFDGNGDYLHDYTNTTPYAFGTGDFTVEAWVNFAGTSGTQGIADSENTTGTGTQADRWFFEKTSAGNLAFGRHNVGIVASGTWAPTSGVWYHVAACRSGTTLRLFVNGTQVASATDSTSYAADGIQIGVDATPNWFNGYISNFRVVKGTALYTSAFTPSTTPLTAVSGTSILTCQSNRFIDTSVNNVALTVNGNTSVQRFSPFAPTAAYSTATIGGSGYFDGTGDYLSCGSQTAYAVGSGNFTAELWFYPTNVTATSYSTLINTRAGAVNDSTAWVVSYESSGRVIFYSDGFLITSATGLITNGQWFHIALVRSGNTATLYLNGISVGTANISAYNFTRNELSVGANNNGSEMIQQAYIANVRLVKGSAVYTSNFTPPTAPLTAIANTSLLLNMTNGAIFDNAMMNDLETVGNAQISTSVVKFGTGSLAFDGSGDSLNGIAASPNFQFGTGDFTVEMWVYTSNLSNFQTLLDTRSGDTQSAWCLFLDNTGKPYWYDASGVQLSSTAVVSNTWTHLAVSRSGSTLRMFLSGVQVFSGTNSNAQNPTGTFYVGRNAVNAFLYTGYIDDLRITKGVARYTANFTPPTAAFPDT